MCCYDFHWWGRNSAVQLAAKRSRLQQFSSLPILSPAAAVGLFCNDGAGLPETAELGEGKDVIQKEVAIRERDIQIFNRRQGVSEIFIWKETSGEVQIRVGQHSQQTLEVSPWKGGTHLAIWHTAARCSPRCPVTHLFYATAEYKQCSSSCVNGYRTVLVICELVSSLGSLYIRYLSSHTTRSNNILKCTRINKNITEAPITCDKTCVITPSTYLCSAAHIMPAHVCSPQ